MLYINYAFDTYRRFTFPEIQSSFMNIDEGIKELGYIQSLLAYCAPEESSPSGRRFYPSSLFLLFYKFLTNNEQVPPNVLKVAAGLELFHNSSLCHDDVIDSHEIRRELPTIVAQYGKNEGLLGGNFMVAQMLNVLDDCSTEYVAQVRKEFTRAMFYLCSLILLYEPLKFSILTFLETNSL